jgi:ATP synthase protein I
MAERDSGKNTSPEETFSRSVGEQERRKLRAMQARSQVWSGLGMLGLVGWSVGAPTLLGTFIGVWLDNRHPGTRSWTLTLLFAGLCVGCANAWHWITREQKAIHREEEKEK